MNESLIAKIEDSFKNLPVSDQLLLIERLVHRVNQASIVERRGANQGGDNNLDDQLALMAADPEIREELRKIEIEFASTAADGLETI